MHILLCSLSVWCGLCCVLCYNMSDAAPKKDFMWSTKDTSSNSIVGSDHLTKLLVRHHYRLRRKCRNPTVATGTVRYGTVQCATTIIIICIPPPTSEPIHSIILLCICILCIHPAAISSKSWPRFCGGAFGYES